MAGWSASVWSTVSALLLPVWLIGTTAAVAALGLSLWRAHRLARTAGDLHDPAWRIAADAIARRVGLRRPARLLASSEVGTPMAGGVWRPTVFLPADSERWSAERRDVVLAHEIAHLVRRDPLRHVVVRLAVAFYWFHPLAWIAARQAAAAREQACDEAVLAMGTPRSTYAGVLLDLAESMSSATAPLGALPMVQRSLLETRVMAILNEEVRPATRRFLPVLASGIVMLTLLVAMAQPVVRAAAPHVVLSVVTTVGAPAAIPVPVPLVRIPTRVAPTTTSADGRQVDSDRDSACWWDRFSKSSFSGSVSTSNVGGGRTVVREQIGSRGADRVIQKSFGNLRLCMLAEDVGDRNDGTGPSEWLSRASRVVLEARGPVVQRLEVERQAGGGRTSWQVGDATRAFDAAAQRWRDDMLAVLDATWELSTLRGEVSSLRGEISSARGEESSLRGEISSLMGEVSSMRGHASSVRGEESSLRGEISSIRGHVSSLYSAISSERGAISSLEAARSSGARLSEVDVLKRVKAHEAEIARIEREIRDFNADAKVAAVQRRLDGLDTDGKVADIEADIRAFDLRGKVAAVERRIAALDVAGKVAAIEREIAALDADRRSAQLNERMERELKRLELAIAGIR